MGDVVTLVKPTQMQVRTWTAEELSDTTFPETQVLDSLAYLPFPGRILIWGQEGSFKTWWALRSVLAAVGSNQAHRALILAGEGSEASMKERLSGIAKGLGMYLRTLGDRLQICFDQFWIDQPQGAEVLRTLVKEVKPTILDVDPLTCYFSGDENKIAEVKLFLSRMNEIIGKGISGIVVHHANKGTKENPSSPRGSTAFPAWTDSMLEFQPKGDDKTLIIHRKMRDRKKNPPRLYRFSENPEMYSYEFELLAEGAGVDVILAKPKVAPKDWTGEILAAIATLGSCSYKQLQTHLNNMSGKILAPALQVLQASGRIERYVSNRYTYYRVRPASAAPSPATPPP